MYSLTKVTFTVFHCLLSFDSEYGGSSNGKKKKKTGTGAHCVT